MNESTLAGLRPGRSTFERISKLYPLHYSVRPIGTMRMSDPCSHLELLLDGFTGPVIQTIHVQDVDSLEGKCQINRGSQWISGRGLRIGDSLERVVALYGEPDSRSPSTKARKQLELLFYAFDWAGPDVPQVMQVLCTAPKNGKPGKVVEITLAAASL